MLLIYYMQNFNSNTNSFQIRTANHIERTANKEQTIGLDTVYKHSGVL